MAVKKDDLMKYTSNGRDHTWKVRYSQQDGWASARQGRRWQHPNRHSGAGVGPRRLQKAF